MIDASSTSSNVGLAAALALSRAKVTIGCPNPGQPITRVNVTYGLSSGGVDSSASGKAARQNCSDT
jgi:hypothetical protein